MERRRTKPWVKWLFAVLLIPIVALVLVATFKGESKDNAPKYRADACRKWTTTYNGIVQRTITGQELLAQVDGVKGSAEKAASLDPTEQPLLTDVLRVRADYQNDNAADEQTDLTALNSACRR